MPPHLRTMRQTPLLSSSALLPQRRCSTSARRCLSRTAARVACAQSSGLGPRLRVDLYFERKPLRRLMWCGISAFSGYYLANTVSLTFGALAVNDIMAAALSVAFVEYASRSFYNAWPRPQFSLWLLHTFKLGFQYALICDAFKLGG